MAFRMTRTLTVDADEALRRIVASAGVWRESELPPELLKARVFGVTVWKQECRFGLTVDSPSEASWTHLVGEVVGRPGGGSVVRARIGRVSSSRFAGGYWLLAVIVTWCIVWGHAVATGAWLAAIGVAAYLIQRGQDRAVTYEGDAVARLLADRLDGAVASVLLEPQPMPDDA